MTPDTDLATLRQMTRLIRDAVGFALAEKNIPHVPTWTLLVPQHLDDIDTAADRLETELAGLPRGRMTASDPLDRIEAEAEPYTMYVGYVRKHELLTLVEIARAARAVVKNGARMPPSDPPLLPDEISELRAALARLDSDTKEGA